MISLSTLTIITLQKSDAKDEKRQKNKSAPRFWKSIIPLTNRWFNLSKGLLSVHFQHACIVCIAYTIKNESNWEQPQNFGYTLCAVFELNTYICHSHQFRVHVLLQLYIYTTCTYNIIVLCTARHHYENSLFMNFQWSVCSALALYDQIIYNFKFTFIFFRR